jgi:HEAT repeat protein
VWALGALGDVRAFEPLLQRLGDEDGYTFARRRVGRWARWVTFVPLNRCYRLGDEILRSFARRRVRRWARWATFVPLNRCYNDWGMRIRGVRAAACEALGKLGFGAEAQLLSEALGAKTEAVEQLRARIAGGEERLWRPLLAALADSEADRAAVSRLLGALGDVRAFEPLLQRLGDEDSGVRAAACEALGKLGFGAEAQLLSEALGAKTEAVKQLRARIAGGEERRGVRCWQLLDETHRQFAWRRVGRWARWATFVPLNRCYNDWGMRIATFARRRVGRWARWATFVPLNRCYNDWGMRIA